MNGDVHVCTWSLPLLGSSPITEMIPFVYTHAHYMSTPIAADRYCTHTMVAWHVVYHARNDTLSHAGEDTKEHYREARRVLRKAPPCHEKLHIPEACHSHPPLSSLQGSGLRRGLGNTGKICRFFCAIEFLAQVHKV